MKLKSPLFVIIIAVIAALGALQSVFADVIGPGAAPVIVPASAPTSIYYHIGALNLTVPWDEVNVVYLYDLNGKRSLVGGEAVVAKLWHFDATAGAVTSIDGHGAPYVGGNLWFPNPVPQLAILNTVKPGVFGGYDWNRGAAIWGFKAAVSIF